MRDLLRELVDRTIDPAADDARARIIVFLKAMPEDARCSELLAALSPPDGSEVQKEAA